MKKILIKARINELIDRIRELEAINAKRPLTGEECVDYINYQREKEDLVDRIRKFEEGR